MHFNKTELNLSLLHNMHNKKLTAGGEQCSQQKTNCLIAAKCFLKSSNRKSIYTNHISTCAYIMYVDKATLTC